MEHQCKIAINGMLPKMKKFIKEHLATVAAIPGFASPTGYARDHFTTWAIMVGIPTWSWTWYTVIFYCS